MNSLSKVTQNSDLNVEHLDTLQKFGNIFQSKVISCLISNQGFLEQIYDILTPHYFESEVNQWIVDRIIWYYGEYKTIPTIEVFAKELKKPNSVTDIIKSSVIEQLKYVYIHVNDTDLTYVKNEFIEFARNQSIKNAILEGASLLQRGRYEEIKSIIDRAMKSGMERDIGHDWQNNLAQRISKTSRNPISTPWACINAVLDGGLGAGELGCIIAPSGAGKSWMLRAIGFEAMRQGKLVVDYTFELSDTYIGLRYDSIATGISPSEIKNNVELVNFTMKQIPGQAIIKHFPTRTATANHISAHLSRLIQYGYKPDLVIIDYADLMRSSQKFNARYEEYEYIYEDIRGLLGEFKLPGWTASQSQRSAMQDDVVEADKIAGAYAKIFTADVVFSVSRQTVDKTSNTARVHLIKNRFGPDGMVFPAHLDLSKGQVEIYDADSPDGQRLSQTMADGTDASATPQTFIRQQFLKLQGGKISSFKSGDENENPPIASPKIDNIMDQFIDDDDD